MHGVTGYTPGLFDLFHVGHLGLLRRAREACGHLTVGVVTDELAEEIWGHRPFVPFNERLELISHVRYVDRTVAVADPHPRSAWDSLRFHLFFAGAETVCGDARLERALADTGVRIVRFPDISSTTSTTLHTALARIPARTSVA